MARSGDWGCDASPAWPGGANTSQPSSTMDAWHVSPHAHLLIIACWQLGQREDYQALQLARWVQQLGYSGHFSTRSRRCNVTLGSRRIERKHTRTG